MLNSDPNSNKKPDLLDENILNRLAQLDASQPISNSVPSIPEEPVSNFAVPLIDLNDSTSTEDADHRSFLETSATDITRTANHRIQCKDGDVWLSGTALLCACPDCAAPMSIRIWLRLADCWRCNTSISLSEEQLRAVEKLVDLAPTPKQLELPPGPQQLPATPRPPAPPVDLPPPPPPPIDALDRELEELSRGSFIARIIQNGFKLTPAWMVSLILHLIIILILALIVLSDNSYLPSTITLSTFISSEPTEGGDIRMVNPDDKLQDDLLNSNMTVKDKELRHVLQKANQDAKQLQVDPQPIAPLPDIDRIKKNITTQPSPIMSFAARDPRVRAEIVRKQGGTTITEAAVSRGIRWLASVQNNDGGWSLQNHRRHMNKSNGSDIMGTSLALLPMLANGDLRAGYTGQAGMYAHGQATIVLCEALALTGDQKFKDPAQRAIHFIELSQHSKGGWRYRGHGDNNWAQETGDTSVFGWQMMALQSARAPELGLEVDDSTLKLADYFLDTVTVGARFNNRRNTRLPKGSAYCYQRGKSATGAMTAEAILCRMYLGWKKDDPRLSKAVEWLIQDHFPNARNPNLYYWYYGTQVMHHYGGEPWEKWNDKMRELLIRSQSTRGSFPGSWDPNQFEWGSKGGRIYSTSLAVCTLEVYYRHLPLFKQIELDR